MSKFTYTHLETGEILYSIIDIGSCVGKYLFTTSLGTKKIVHSSKVHKSKSYIYPMTEGYNCYNNDNDPNIKGVITNLQQFDNLYKWFQNKGKDWQCYIKDGGDYQGAITCNNTPSTATDVNILPKGAQGNNINSTDVSHCKNVCSIITDCCGFTYGEFQSEGSSTYACNLFTELKQSVNKQCAQRKERDPWSVVYVRHPAPPPIKPTPVPNLKYKPSPNVNCYDKNQGGTVTTEVSSNYPGDDKPFYQLLQWFLHQPPEGSKDGPEYGANKTCWRGTTYQKKTIYHRFKNEGLCYNINTDDHDINIQDSSTNCINYCNNIPDCCGFTYGIIPGQSNINGCNLFTGLKINKNGNPDCSGQQNYTVYVKQSAPHTGASGPTYFPINYNYKY